VAWLRVPRDRLKNEWRWKSHLDALVTRRVNTPALVTMPTTVDTLARELAPDAAAPELAEVLNALPSSTPCTRSALARATRAARMWRCATCLRDCGSRAGLRKHLSSKRRHRAGDKSQLWKEVAKAAPPAVNRAATETAPEVDGSPSPNTHPAQRQVCIGGGVRGAGCMHMSTAYICVSCVPDSRGARHSLPSLASQRGSVDTARTARTTSPTRA
jgi:hypothetical protein